MKKIIFPLSFAVCFLFVGCTDSTTKESLAAPEIEAIELTDEEVQILEASEQVIEEAEPVTKDNYEDALKALEDELASEQ